MLVIMKKRLNKKNYFKKFFETKNVENKEAKVKDKRKADRKKFKSDEVASYKKYCNQDLITELIPDRKSVV